MCRFFHASLILLLTTAPVLAQTSKKPTVVRSITLESVYPQDHASGYGLPLVGTWNAAPEPHGFSPAYQLKQIQLGHHLMPTFWMPARRARQVGKRHLQVFEQVARMRLPFTLVGTQWERVLSEDSRFFNRPADQNPNVITPQGKVLPMVSPFGPVRPWYEAGWQWGSSAALKQLQNRYPDPPLILFLSNNEHKRLPWHQVRTSARYLKQFGPNRSDAFKKRVVGQGWIKRYRALQKGIGDALVSPAWRRNARFVAYNAFHTRTMGHWRYWDRHALNDGKLVSPWPLAWDGASVGAYLKVSSPITDFNVYSVQIEAMNSVFAKKQAMQLNPSFWFELSFWDGYVGEGKKDKRKFFQSLGQQYTPARYMGMIQFTIWLLRPRLVREYRGSSMKRQEVENYFQAVMQAVDAVYQHPVLSHFWRRGRLVENPRGKHPYQIDIPEAFQNEPRWFLLDVQGQPPPPWKPETALSVFALALVVDQAPNRHWLLYAHAPQGDQKAVELDLPGFGKVKIDVSVDGVFYAIDELTGQIKPIPKLEPAED